MEILRIRVGSYGGAEEAWREEVAAEEERGGRNTVG